MEWKKYKLGVCASITTGFPFDGTKYAKEGIRVLRGENIGSGSLHWEERVDKRWNEDFAQKEKYSIKEGDIVMQMDGNIGKNLARVYEADALLIAQRVACVRAQEGFDQDFLYGILRTDTFKQYLQRCATGTSIKHISLAQISKFELSAPEYAEQAKIGKLLSDLDRKIALNRSINHNLEAMAKQLYDYWFVQFDFPNAEGKPYKSSGGKMVWNEELGRVIPEHWQVKPLQAIATVKKGSMITEVNATQGNVKVVAGGVTFSYYNGESNRPKNTITVSGSGANAGYINFWREPIFASDCTTVNCKDDIDTLLCLYGMQLFQEVLYNWAVGAAQPHVYPKQVGILPMVCVPTEIKQRIKETLLSINEQIGVNLDEIERLSKQRDALLPLLMNGQATVNYDLSND